MPIIFWSDELSVKVDLIDKQHMKLLDLLNKIFDAMSKGEGKKVLGDIIEELDDYTRYHFKTEETLMEKHNYPDLEAHKLQHKKFIEQIQKFREDFKKTQSGLVSIEILKFLTNWLKNHILEIDKKYTPYMTGEK